MTFKSTKSEIFAESLTETKSLISTKKIELLAPAGSFDSFIAAIENGADAVYIGLSNFSARQQAKNFDMEELKKAVYYAHSRNAKVYLTMNTLIHDAEMIDALKCAKEAFVSGVDAFIVQDLGFASNLKNMIPEVSLHGSTQMTIYNTDGVKALEPLGFERIVLARELHCKEIQKICSNTKMEIEIFVHGALCVCYSGQCLMSSLIGQRSGNRGRCAQPCRLPYDIMVEQNIKKSGYLLSTKDLCSVEYLEQVINTGVQSLKIEGRMKNPAYVATCVKVYRKYIDYLTKSEPQEIAKDKKELLLAFNRGGFSNAYLGGMKGSSIVYEKSPGNIGLYIGKVVDCDNRREYMTTILEEEIATGDYVEIRNKNTVNSISENTATNGFSISSIIVDNIKVKVAKPNEKATIGFTKNNICEGDLIYKTFDKKRTDEIEKTYSGKIFRKIPIDLSVWILENKPLLIKASDGEVEAELESNEIPEIAKTKALTIEKVREQLDKTGNTHYFANNINIFLDQGITVPISAINALRRDVLLKIEENKITAQKKEREKYQNIDVKLIDLGLSKFREKTKGKQIGVESSEKPCISAMFYDIKDEIHYQLENVKRVYLPVWDILNPKKANEILKIKERVADTLIWFPTIMKGNYTDLKEQIIKKCEQYGIDGFLAGNISQLEMFSDNFNKICSDVSFNVINSYTLNALKEMNIDTVSLSVELNYEQLRKIKKSEGVLTEMAVYGKLPLMISEFCPIGANLGGYDEKNLCSKPCMGEHKYFLRDRKGKKMEVFCDKISCNSYIFNSDKLFLLEEWNKIKTVNFDFIRLIFTDENAYEIGEIVKIHSSVIGNGTVLPEFSEIVSKIKSNGHTKGHLLRGV